MQIFVYLGYSGVKLIELWKRATRCGKYCVPEKAGPFTTLTTMLHLSGNIPEAASRSALQSLSL
jgi:hypothetical protein